MGSVTSFRDMTGEVLPTGVLIVQRVSRQPLRWLCRCLRCSSERVFSHEKVLAALNGASGNVAQCDLSECRLFKTARKPEPPTPRPDHTKDSELRVQAAPMVSPAPKAKPAPAPHPLWSDYQRACEAWKRWGQEPCTFDGFKFLQEYKPTFYRELMANVAAFEDQGKYQEFERAIEAQERLRRKADYGSAF